MDGLDQETLDERTQRLHLDIPARRRLWRDEAALPWMHVEKALGRQFADCFLDGVWVDVEFLADGADSGKTVARQEAPGGNRTLYGVDDLLVDRLAWLDFDRERKHAMCIIYSNTRDTRQALFSICRPYRGNRHRTMHQTQELNEINECQPVAKHGLVPQDKWPDTLRYVTNSRSWISPNEWLA